MSALAADGASAPTPVPAEVPLTLGELTGRAQDLLAPGVHTYFAGGAGDEITVSANDEAWRRLALRQRVLVGVPNRRASVQLMGRANPLPMAVAPMAWQRLAHPDGEIGLARGATEAGALYCLSTFATTLLEDVAAAVADPTQLWMQAQFFQERDVTMDIVGRARDAGYGAIVLTVDQPVLGRRDRSISAAFERPGSPNVKGRPTLPDPTITWDDVAWLVAEAGLPVLAKGVLDPRDVPLAIDAGCAGVIVSNHGGRQLDTVLPTAVALRPVVEAAAGQVPVLVDGGIRRGSDIVKALALGASAVLVGRPMLWALAVGGEAAARAAAGLYATELDVALGVVGVDDITELTPDHVLAAPWGSPEVRP